jgi:hypothetical protein
MSPLLIDKALSGKYCDVDVYGDSAVPGNSKGPGVRTLKSAVIFSFGGVQRDLKLMQARQKRSDEMFVETIAVVIG